MADFSPASMLESALQNYSEAKPRSQQVAIGPSAIHSCRRQVYHQIKGTFKTNRDTNFLPSLMGTAIHTMIEEALGSNYSDDIFGDDFLKEVPVEFEGLPGHIDLYIISKRMIVDWKTSTKSKLASTRYPWPSAQYKYQVHVYAYLLMNDPKYKALGYMVDTVAIIGVARDGGLQDIVEYLEPYNEELALQGIKWINDQYANAEKDVIPPPEKNAKTYCSLYCSFYDPTEKIGCPGLEKGGY